MTQPVNMQYPQAYVPQMQPVQAPTVPVAQPAPTQAISQGYYTYPASNFYQYPQATAYPTQPQANAVNINIINPQAYTGSPAAQPMSPTMPAPQVIQPMPQQPVYEPQAVPPAPVITQPEPVPATTPAAAPAVATPEAPAPAVDLQTFNAKLRSQNIEDQAAAIEQIAELTQTNPQLATAFLDTQIMEGLLSVIAKDTTGLQGPTPKQLELRQNIITGKQLTPEETAEANQITPMEIAERNKQYSLYTIAFLQNLLASEVEQRNGIKLDVKDLPCIEQVVQTAKSDPNPLLRVSAISALSHIAKPEYNPVLTTIFELAKADADPNVQEAAQKALEQLNGTPAPAAAA